MKVWAFVFATLVLAGCAKTEVPAVKGHIVNRANGEAIANATIIFVYSGRTRFREMWFHAAFGNGGTTCIRQMAVSDQRGEFEFPAFAASGYFGDPKMGFISYHPSYLGLVVPDYVQSHAVQLYGWRGEGIPSFSLWTAKELDGHGPMIDRFEYLDAWLANSSIVDSCDHEPDEEKVDEFLLSRFEEWVSSVPNERPGRPAACDAFLRFELSSSNRTLIRRFLSLRAKARLICGSTHS